MNEEKKDDLLEAFENPNTDPTPDITPVMPEVSQNASTQPSVSIFGEQVAPAAPVAPVAPAYEAPVEVAPVAPTYEAPVEAAPVAPAYEAPVEAAPVTSAYEAPVVSADSMMAPEFQNAPAATPVEVAATIAPEAPVEVTPTASVETSTPENTGMQDVPATVSVEPAIAVTQDVKKEDPQEDPNFLKKNLKFILLICVLIGLFIFFLPQIMKLLGINY